MIRTPIQKDIEWERVDTIVPGAKSYVSHPDGALRCIVGKEGGKWHLSMSHPDRYPTWDELADARYRFVPDRAHMAMLAPPRAEFVNAHAMTLHLWEVPELAEVAR